MAEAASHVFHRSCVPTMPVAEHGDGPYLIDNQGRRVLDACGGAAVSCLGHSNAHVIDAIKAQAETLAYAHTGFFTSDIAEKLADRLIAKAPAGLEKVYFVSGGSEAMEAAIKLARQYFLERGEHQRSIIIGRWQSYHGNTLGALSAGGNRWRRGQFEPLLATAMHHVSPCHAWRWKPEGMSDVDYGQMLAKELDDTIQELGADKVAAFLAEPVVGATMGAVPPVEGYFKAIREVCDKHGVLLILDEVMCGMGRTGSLFACEQDGVAPDMLAIAKGLGAGYQPIGATLVAGHVYQAIADGSGFFQHGHTYLGHSMACAAANAVLDEFEDRDLIARVQVLGKSLRERLESRFGQHPHIGDIRGRGLFLGLEIVEDRATKEPFAPEKGIAKAMRVAAMNEALMIYPGGGTVDGRNGDHILLAPPFILDDDHLDIIVERLGRAVDHVLPAAAAA